MFKADWSQGAWAVKPLLGSLCRGLKARTCQNTLNSLRKGELISATHLMSISQSCKLTW